MACERRGNSAWNLSGREWIAVTARWDCKTIPPGHRCRNPPPTHTHTHALCGVRWEVIAIADDRERKWRARGLHYVETRYDKRKTDSRDNGTARSAVGQALLQTATELARLSDWYMVDTACMDQWWWMARQPDTTVPPATPSSCRSLCSRRIEGVVSDGAGWAGCSIYA